MITVFQMKMNVTLIFSPINGPTDFPIKGAGTIDIRLVRDTYYL